MTGQDLKDLLMSFVDNPNAAANDGKLQAVEVADTLKTAFEFLSDKSNAKIAYVSSIGDDSTAQVGTSNMPFASLLAAKNSDAQVIVVVGGEYSENFENDETLCGKEWHFLGNPTLNFTGSTLFNDTVGVKTVVRGDLKIVAESGSIFKLAHQNSEMFFECESIEQNNAVGSGTIVDFYNCPFKKFVLKCDSLISKKFIFGKGADGAGGDRTGMERGTYHVNVRFMQSACMWNEFTGLRNYDIVVNIDTHKGETKDDGGIDFGYGMEDCDISFFATKWEGRYLMDVSGKIKNTTLRVSFRDALSTSVHGYGIQVAVNNADFKDSSIIIQDSLLRNNAASARGCFNVGNHAGQNQVTNNVKVIVRNSELRTEGTNKGHPLSLGGNNRAILQNVHLSTPQDIPPIFKGESGIDDGIPRVICRGSVSANNYVTNGVNIIGSELSVVFDSEY